MNKLIIIGNLTRDPESRDVNGTPLCTFTVAVNRRVKQGEHPQADYVRVSAWRQLGETCAKYLAKGRKVYVEGPVSTHGYSDSKTGEARAALEMRADSVEFLTPRGQQQVEPETDADGFTDASDDENNPF